MVRYPAVISVAVLNEGVVAAIRDLKVEEIAGSLVIVSPGSIRVRRPGALPGSGK
jgi:hypothetical protein